MGRGVIFLGSALLWALRPPAKVRLIIQQIRAIGVDSLLVVLLAGLFTGMVLGLQGYYSLRKFNAESFLGRGGGPEPAAGAGTGAVGLHGHRPDGLGHGGGTGLHARHRADRRHALHGRQSR